MANTKIIAGIFTDNDLPYHLVKDFLSNRITVHEEAYHLDFPTTCASAEVVERWWLRKHSMVHYIWLLYVQFPCNNRQQLSLTVQLLGNLVIFDQMPHVHGRMKVSSHFKLIDFFMSMMLCLQLGSPRFWRKVSTISGVIQRQWQG